jgi:glycosyltransferase involved in cell wall biosynthesis
LTIWYDYTTTLRNSSRNGIANVEWSIGHALRDLDPDVRCFRLSGGRHLVEIEPAELVTAVYAIDGPPLGEPVVGVTWRDRVRGTLRSRLGSSGDVAIRTLSIGYAAMVSARAAVLKRVHELFERFSTRTTLEDLVGPHDVVVSMGADWSSALSSALLELRRSTGCRVVTMVYDLVPLTHTHLAFSKDRALFERYYAGLVAASDLITCISRQSQLDLLNHAAAHGLSPRATAVVRLGDARLGAMVEQAPFERDDFFLWVGTIERRKNLGLLYDALRILESDQAPLPTLVVAGSPGWGVDDLLAEIRLRSTGAGRAIVMLGSVGDDELEELYRRARALLFPSHYEGWGLPVREAAVHGCPVAAGDNPAVREALDDFHGAVFLPVDDPEPWAAYLRTPPPRVEPADVHDWSSTARELLTLLESTAVTGGRLGTSL